MNIGTYLQNTDLEVFEKLEISFKPSRDVKRKPRTRAQIDRHEKTLAKRKELRKLRDRNRVKISDKDIKAILPRCFTYRGDATRDFPTVLNACVR